MWKRIIIIVALIVLLLAIVFINSAVNVKQVEAPAEVEQEESFTEPLAVKHQYKDGQHVFVGDIELPNPCYSYNATIEESDNENVKNIVLEYKEMEEVESCVQVITNANFRVAYEGVEDLEFQLFINGQKGRLNTFEIPAHVDIEQFELFLKG